MPTPLDQRREPDLSYVEQTARSIQPHLQRGQLIVLESTTYPGTTEELVLPILEESGLRCPIAHGPDPEHIPTDFYLAFSPEREDPGNKQYGLAQIPKVVGGVNPPSGRAAQSLYAQIVARVIPVSTTRVPADGSMRLRAKVCIASRVGSRQSIHIAVVVRIHPHKP